MTDKSKAFEAGNGFILDDSGNEGAFVTGGSLSPIGLDLQEGTLYLQNTSQGVILWQKYNNNPTSGWRKYPALDISFDPTGTAFEDVNALTVDAALRSIDGIDLNSLTAYESFSSVGAQSTTSNGYVTKSGFPYTTGLKESGKYIIDFTSNIAQDSNNSEAGFRVQYRLGTSGTWIDLFEIIVQFPRSGGAPPITSFVEVELLTDSVFQIRLQWGQTNKGGSATISNSIIKLGKVAS
jgi:hypothetical protein